MAYRVDPVRRARGLASVPCLLLIISSTLASAAARTGVHPVNWRKPYNAANYGFLGALSDGRSVIQLGESIHMTDEFPRVRLQFIRYLHEQKGFDVLAFEGSWVQAWLAQNALYQCDMGQACLTRAQRLAWFPLWQTEPMRDVLAYVASTQKTLHPLYLASFDIETGDDDEFQGSGSRAFQTLLSVLGEAAGAPNTTVRQAWIEALSPFFGCYPNASRPSETQKQQAAEAVQQFRSWINSMSKTGPTMHSKALGLIPDILLQEIELCTIVPENPLGPATYQILRDQFNAQNTIALRDNISDTHRIILWAHHSHVRENWSPTLPSLGQRLRAMIGNQLYTIGLFAGDGEVIAVDDNADPPFSLRKRTLAEGSLEDELYELAPYDFILDLSLAGPAWSRKMPFQDENGVGHVSLSDAFDAVVFVHHIHPPEPFAGRLHRR